MIKSILIITLLTSALANAALEDEKKIFRMCYSQLAKKRVKANHPIYTKVKNGQIRGADGCIQLINSVQLDSSGKIPMLPGGKIDYDRQKIFQSIFDIHHDIFSGILGINNLYKFTDYYGTYKLVDESEMAYHFTYPFVKPNTPFSSALTNDFALRSIRYSEAFQYFPWDSMFNKEWQGSIFFNLPVLLKSRGSPIEYYTETPSFDQGLLIGMKPAPSVPMQYRYGSEPFLEMDAYGHFGGGALGTQAYLMLTGNEYVDKFQGGVLNNMPRNFAVSVMRELLCRDLPVLRGSDVSSFVNLSSPVTFHQNSKCMRCHATIDPIVYTLKNKFNLTFDVKQGLPQEGHNLFLETGKPYPRTMKSMMVVRRHMTKPDFNPQGELLLADSSNHSRSRPVGHFRMRSAIDGSLYDQQVEDVDGLAAAIVNTNDFYACAVKRYVTYFTGHDTKLFDPADGNYSEFDTAFDERMRNFIFQLGAEFKEHQNPKLIWKRIFNSKIYLNPEQGDFGEVTDE